MAHTEKMKNVRLPATMVDRAAALKHVNVLDLQLPESAGRPGWGWSGLTRRAPFDSATKVLASAVRLGLEQLEKRHAALLKEREAARKQLPLTV